MKGYKFSSDNGSTIVESMRLIPIEGNVIPHTWYKFVKYPNGKPCVNAIIILADIVYWYRPVEIRDERTGEVVEYRKKFEKTYLQKSAPDLAKLFGLSIKQVRDALDLLEAIGVIRKHIVETMIDKSGTVLSNVPYIELIPEKLREITVPPMTYRTEGYALQDRGVRPTSETYTETTTEITNRKKKHTVTGTAPVTQIQPPLMDTTDSAIQTVTEKPKRERAQDPLFNAIRDTFGIADTERIGSLRTVMLGTSKSPRYKGCNFDIPATGDEVLAFGDWYRRKYPNLEMPQDFSKIQRNFYKFRATGKPRTRINRYGQTEEYFEGAGWIEVSQ